MKIGVSNFVMFMISTLLFICVSVFAHVSFSDSVLYLCYLLFVVFIPGQVLFKLFFPSGSWFRLVSISLLLGYTLEVLIFFIISVLEYTERLEVFYAVIVLLSMALLTWQQRHRWEQSTQKCPKREQLLYLVVTATVLITLKWHSLDSIKLPLLALNITHYQDLVWHLSNAAAVKQYRFPIEEFRVSGETWQYYFVPYIHIASVSRLTGIELSTILYRLFPIELYLIWTTMLFWAGRTICRTHLAGVVVVLLVLVIGSMQGFFVFITNLVGDATPYDLRDQFLNFIFWAPINSPNFLFGALFYTVIIVLIYELYDRVDTRHYVKQGITLVLFLIGCFTKSVLAPSILLGLVGMLLVNFKRLNDRRRLRFTSTTLAVLGSVYLIARQYTEGVYSGFVKFQPLKGLQAEALGHEWIMAFLNKSPALSGIFNESTMFLSVISALLLIGVMMGYAPLSLFGSTHYLINRRFKLGWGDWWLVCVFLVPVSVLFMTSMAGGEWNFLIYSSIPAAILASKGLSVIFSNPVNKRSIWTISLTSVLLISGLSTIVLKIVFPTINESYYRERYGINPLLSSNMLEGLQWIRENSEERDVIAVNFTQGLFETELKPFVEQDKYWYYSAYSERAIFLEGGDKTAAYAEWRNNPDLTRSDYGPAETKPFSDRRVLLRKLFDQQDISALIEIRDKYHVHYLLNDKRRQKNEWLTSIGKETLEMVFSNDHVDVYTLTR